MNNTINTISGLILIIFIMIILYKFTPFITTKYNEQFTSLIKNNMKLNQTKQFNKFINSFNNKNNNATEYTDNLTKNAIEKYENSIRESAYKEAGRIDDNGCYNPIFRKCNKKRGKDGYEIFTPFQSGCIYPDMHISGFDAAFAQVDKYLNIVSSDSNVNDNINEHKKTCINKPEVKTGLIKFGLCNKEKLKKRCTDLNTQKNNIVAINEHIDLEDIETGISNMKHIYNSCFPTEEPLIC